jgi:NADP-dependent 3-hydroxy acid dehydrogenase YdfG
VSGSPQLAAGYINLMKDFSGKIVYIIGGSSSIGLSIARKLSHEGAHIIIFARQKDRLESAWKQ